MSGYNIEYFLKDFADRTVKNLEFIESNKNQHNLYEVTQLINSLLGLIIIPYEAKGNNFSNKYLKGLSLNDYRNIENVISKCKKEKRLFCDYYGNDHSSIEVPQFIRHIRNSIAHGGNNGIHFFPISENGEISHLIFYDNNSIQKRPIINEFCVKLTISELRIIVFSIKNLYCLFEKRDKNVVQKQKHYYTRIVQLEELMINERKILTNQ